MLKPKKNGLSFKDKAKIVKGKIKQAITPLPKEERKANRVLKKDYKEYLKSIEEDFGTAQMKKGGNWIQGAIKKKGSLTATAKNAGAVNKEGKIKKSWLKEKAKGSGKTARRARLAITLSKLRKNK
jgi:hypothetical protein